MDEIYHNLYSPKNQFKPLLFRCMWPSYYHRIYLRYHAVTLLFGCNFSLLIFIYWFAIFYWPSGRYQLLGQRDKAISSRLLFCKELLSENINLSMLWFEQPVPIHLEHYKCVWWYDWIHLQMSKNTLCKTWRNLDKPDLCIERVQIHYLHTLQDCSDTHMAFMSYTDLINITK